MPRPRKGAAALDGAKLRADILDELRETLGGLAGAVPWVASLFDRLEQGEAVELYRWDLPDWSPDRHVGRPHDRILLHADDTLSLMP